MKDTDKVELTAGAIKSAAESCGTAKEVLKKLFPEVFKESPEWEEMPTSDFKFEYLNQDWGPNEFVRINHTNGSGVIILYPNGTWINNGRTIKVEHGRIWRRKS